MHQRNSYFRRQLTGGSSAGRTFVANPKSTDVTNLLAIQSDIASRAAEGLKVPMLGPAQEIDPRAAHWSPRRSR